MLQRYEIDQGQLILWFSNRRELYYPLDRLNFKDFRHITLKVYLKNNQFESVVSLLKPYYSDENISWEEAIKLVKASREGQEEFMDLDHK